MKQPCKRDCPERSEDCATECIKWKIYVAWRNKKYQKRLEEIEHEEQYYAGKDKILHKNFTRRRK